MAPRLHRAVAILVAISLAGCSSMPVPADILDKASPGRDVDRAEHNRLIDHPSPIVSAPAGLGLGIGTIIGIPLMVAALPITLALGIAAWSDDPKADNLKTIGNAIAWPDAVCAVGGAYALGGIPYLIIGDPDPAPRRVAPAPAAPVRPEPRDPPALPPLEDP